MQGVFVTPTETILARSAADVAIGSNLWMDGMVALHVYRFLCPDPYRRRYNERETDQCKIRIFRAWSSPRF